MNEDGHYWSSDSNGKEAWELSFYSGIQGVYSGFCYMGYSVRAVLNDGEPDDAPTGFGKGSTKATIDGKTVDVPWVQLWEVGPKFAKYNVGVTDGKEESYGGYYKWGATEDRNRSSKEYVTGYHVPLIDKYDAATQNWGNNWRMPEEFEYRCLLKYCDKKYVTINGVRGVTFTGRGKYSGNSVFFPKAGFYDNIEGYEINETGCYWSSTPCTVESTLTQTSWDLWMSPDTEFCDCINDASRLFQSVRAVVKE